MGEILTTKLCSRCNTLFRKNSDVGGDYNEEGKLQSYCPQCGVMHPPIIVGITSHNISKRNRHDIGTKIATKHKLPYKQVHRITLTLNFVEDDEFVQAFTKHISTTFHVDVINDVMKCLQGSGKI